MKYLFTVLLYIFSGNLLNLVYAGGPSFDCKNASQWHEKEICSNSMLSDMDMTIASVYKELKNTLPEEEKKLLTTDQKTWINKTRSCKKALHDYGPNDTHGYGKNMAKWCLKNAYRWRKARLKTSLERGIYSPYREKPHCYKLLAQQKILSCLIDGVKPKVVKKFSKYELKIYDYIFDGVGASMLLPGSTDKTYIVDIGERLIITSEIHGDNSCCFNEYRDMPVLIVKTTILSGARLDGCAHYGKGHCSASSSFITYRLDSQKEDPIVFFSPAGFTGGPKIGHFNTSSQFQVPGDRMGWNNEKGYFYVDGYLMLDIFPISAPFTFEIYPVKPDWMMKFSMRQSNLGGIKHIFSNGNIRFKNDASINLGVLMSTIAQNMNEKEKQKIKDFLKACAEKFPDCRHMEYQ